MLTNSDKWYFYTGIDVNIYHHFQPKPTFDIKFLIDNKINNVVNSVINHRGKFFRIVLIPFNTRYEIFKCLGTECLIGTDNINIIMSDKYDLFNIKTIEKFRLYSQINSKYIELAFNYGKLELLKFLRNSDLLNENKFDIARCISYASQKGYCNILNWLKNAGIQLKYDETALDWASQHGHINVLEWWKNSGLPLKYSKSVLDNASLNAQVDVLEWWFNSGLKLEYSEYAFSYRMYLFYKNTSNISNYFYNRDSRYSYLDVLKCWKKSGLHLMLNVPDILADASENGDVDLLEWLKNSDIKLEYDIRPLTYATNKGHINVLEWWKNSRLPLKYDNTVCIGAFYNYNNDALDWWKNSGLECIVMGCVYNRK